MAEIQGEMVNEQVIEKTKKYICAMVVAVLLGQRVVCVLDSFCTYKTVLWLYSMHGAKC